MKTRQACDKIEPFLTYLKRHERPDTFEEVYTRSRDASGFFASEAKATWDILRKEKIESLVEVGRFWGGGLFLLACACRELQVAASLDIRPVMIADGILKEWFEAHWMKLHIETCNTKKFDPHKHTFYDQWLLGDKPLDCVYIDGEHTGPGVKADIEAWQDHTRIIGFHDFGDRGRKNSHRRYFPDVVLEISAAREKYGWKQLGPRGRSEIWFATGKYEPCRELQHE